MFDKIPANRTGTKAAPLSRKVEAPNQKPAKILRPSNCHRSNLAFQFSDPFHSWKDIILRKALIGIHKSVLLLYPWRYIKWFQRAAIF